MKTLLRHEWQQLTRDRTVVTLLVLTVGLSGLALWNGRHLVRERGAELARLAAESAAATAADRAAVEAGKGGGEPWLDPANPYRRSAVATLPPAPLGSLAVGLTDLQPASATLSSYSLPSQPFRLHELGNPLNRLAGSFDLAFVVVFLFPLLVLALGYDVLSAERERGTLALAAAQGASPRRVVVGKLLARGLLVGVLALGLSLSAWLASGGSPAAGVALPVVGWTLLVLAYAAFWFALALAVQALGRSSAENALLLGGAWLLFVIVAPAALHLGASGLHPMPSRYELVARERAAEVEAARVREKLLQEFALDHPELIPAGQPVDWSDFAKSYYATRRDLEARLAPAAAEFERSLAAQQAVIGRYRFLSPAVVTHEALLDLAGSGHHRHRRFVSQIRAFLDDWRARMVPKIFQGQPMTLEDFATLPEFRFQEETSAEIATRLLPALLGLAVPTFLLAVWGLVRLRRVPVLAGQS